MPRRWRPYCTTSWDDTTVAAHSPRCRGDGHLTAFGTGTEMANTPHGLSNVVAVAAGTRHAVALHADGHLTTWGAYADNEDRQIDDALLPLRDVTAIAAGACHSLALHRDGRVTAWGRNDAGQTDIPVSLRDVVAIAGGDSHTLA